MRASTCDTVSRLCVRPVCCWFAFPLVPALGSTGSAADRSALFASFAATTAGPDFPRSFIIGYRFSLPDADQKRDCPGRTRDLPSSDAILLRVICSSTPAGRAWPRLAALSMLRSTLCTVSAPATYPLRIIVPTLSVKLHMWLGLPCQRSGNCVETDFQRTV